MRRQLLTGCAMFALGGSVSLAGDLNNGGDYYAPQASPYSASGIFGDVNLSGTYVGGDADDDFSLDLAGSVVLPFGNGWNAAIEHQLGYLFQAGDWFAAGTGHVFYGGQLWAVGAFLHVDTDDTVGVGVEGAAFVNNVDLIGEVGYFNASPDHWSTSGTVNVYFDPDTAVSGRLGGLWVESGSNAYEADIGIEHRFNSSPISAFAELGWTDFGGPDEFHATAGARMVFGDSGSTLQDFNRRNPF